MSSLYKSNYLSQCNPQEMVNIINGKIKYIPDPKDLEDRQKYIILQHYLIKYLEHFGKTEQLTSLFKKYYEDFFENPSLFIDSPLITDEFINKTMKEKLREKVLEYRNKYFDGLKCKELYEIAMRNNPLNDKQKDQLYSFLTIQLKTGNTKFDKIYENCIKQILDSNKLVTELNDTELKFYCTYISKKAAGKTCPDVHIMKDEGRKSGHENNGVIFINKYGDSTKTIEELTKVVCHETQHVIQEQEMNSINSKGGFDIALIHLFSKYLSTKDYDAYHRNYRYSGAELDAETAGYANAKIFLRMFGRHDLADKIKENQEIKLDKRNYYEAGIQADKKIVTLDQLIVESMDKIIKEHPEELKKYKMLETIYNSDGTRKDLKDLLTRKLNENFIDRGLYDNYFNYEIAKGNVNKIDISKGSVESKKAFFTILGNSYRSAAIKFKDYCEDNESYKDGYLKASNEHVRVSVLYQLTLLNNMADFLNNNMNSLLECKENSKLSHTSFIYKSFIYDFRDFNENSINNDVIKNDPIIKERISKFMDKFNSIVKKYNDQYIKDRVTDLTQDELNSEITTPEGHKETLKEYLYYDMLPRADSHSEIRIKDKKVSIADVIKYYKNTLSDQKKDNDNYSM